MSTYKAPITMEDLALMSGGRPVHHKKPIKTAHADVKKVKAQANKFAKYLDKKQTSKPEIIAKPKPKSAASKPKSSTATKPKPKSATGTKPKSSTATKPKPKSTTAKKPKSSTGTKPKSATGTKAKSVKKTGTSAHPNFKPANNTRPLMKW